MQLHRSNVLQGGRFRVCKRSDCGRIFDVSNGAGMTIVVIYAYARPDRGANGKPKNRLSTRDCNSVMGAYKKARKGS